MHRCLLSLGANLGDRRSTLTRAVCALGELSGVASLRASRWRRSRPVGGPDGQPEFLNGVALVETTIAPDELWHEMRTIETSLGRQRRERWAARTIDLDLLLYDDLVVKTDELTLPHPRMSFRPFVLEPAAEVAGDLWHPVLQATVARLWQQLRDGLDQVLIYGGTCQQHAELREQLTAAFGPISELAGQPSTQVGGVETQSWLLVRPADAGAGPQPAAKRLLPKLAVQLPESRPANATVDDQPLRDRLRGVPTLSADELDAGALWWEVRAAVLAVWPHLGAGPFDA